MLEVRSRPSRPLGSLALLAVLAGCGSDPLGPEAESARGATTLVSAGAVWHYRDDGTDQGAAWRTLPCEPADPNQGPAQLGYGDGDEATTVGFGPDANAKYITTYFRHCFQVADPSQYAGLRVRILRDDGAAVYLNGTELTRSNLPPTGVITYLTPAVAGVSGTDESTFFEEDGSASALSAGSNILAVEVHQVSGTSSDIGLDLELLGLAQFPTATPTATRFPTPPPGVLRFAVIGDYGHDGQPEADVSEMVHGWDPEFIITLGDNNYSFGEASTIDQNIGKYYHDYIYPYLGIYGAGSPPLLGNRFFPSLGNHDWYSATGSQPYQAYFALPGNERYYQFTRDPIDFFVVDSDEIDPPYEPDGVASTSVQGQWIQSALAGSTAAWKVVYMHHPPYSSCNGHGSTPVMQWPYRDWGADIVLAGHDHVYERLEVGALPYIVNGLGGRQGITGFNAPIPGSLVRYNADYGAMLAHATSESLQFQFYNRQSLLIDELVLGTIAPTPTVTPTADPISTPTPTATGLASPRPVASATQTPGSSPASTPPTIAAPSSSPTSTRSPLPSSTRSATSTSSALPTPAGFSLGTGGALGSALLLVALLAVVLPVFVTRPRRLGPGAR